MPFLFILLLFIVGLILTDLDAIFITIGLLLFCIFLFVAKLKKNKKTLIIGLLFLMMGSIIDNVRLPIKNVSNQLALVTKRSEKYCIVKVGVQKYFTYDLDDARLYDIIRISGKVSDFDFKTLESSFDFSKYLINSGVRSKLSVTKVEYVTKNPIDTLGYQQKVINKYKSVESRALVQSLIFGKQNELVRSFSTKLMITSLLSTSGFFLTFVLYGLEKFFAYFIYKKQAKTLSFIVFLPYLFFNINRFSVLRVATLYLISIINERYDIHIPSLNRKCLIYLGFLIINPHLIYNQGYYVPLLITLILEFSYLFLYHRYTFVKNLKRKVLIIAILFPFIVNSNNCFNFLSILITFTLSFYFKRLFFISFLSFYGIYLPFFDDIFKFTFNVLDKINLKYLNVNMPPFNSFGFLIYFIFLFIFIYFKEINFGYFYKKIICLGVACFSLYLVPFHNMLTCEVSFINIGQGDSTLIRYGLKNYLIDTGGNLRLDIATETLIPYFKSKRIYKLDAVFITHYDFDHYGALESLKSNYLIDKIYDYNSKFPVKCGDLTFNNLNTYRTEDEENENNKSLVFNMKIGTKKFLFMGDAPSSIERQIIKNHTIDCDILKLGHHGSKDSSCLEFLKYVNPEMAIISCGKNNKYHHPNKETIQRLNMLKIPYRRTDIESTITYQFRL